MKHKKTIKLLYMIKKIKRHWSMSIQVFPASSPYQIRSWTCCVLIPAQKLKESNLRAQVFVKFHFSALRQSCGIYWDKWLKNQLQSDKLQYSRLLIRKLKYPSLITLSLILLVTTSTLLVLMTNFFLIN